MTSPGIAWALRVSELDDDAQVFLYAVALSMYEGREDRPVVIADVDLASLDAWLVEAGYAGRARAELDAISA